MFDRIYELNLEYKKNDKEIDSIKNVKNKFAIVINTIKKIKNKFTIIIKNIKNNNN